jgi:NAD(P)H-flavin reductase/hemoglobin-like flavoprotein
VDVARLKASFARIAMHGDEVPLHFYSDLFLKHPETRTMFPVSMQAQRAHLVDALVRVVASADNAESLTPFLQDLGRDHRKFGTLAGHYEAVGDSLLATFAYFSGEAWDAELEADWRAAYELIASVMTAAANEDERERPAFWKGTVVATERRTFDIAVLTVRTDPTLDYVPGQSVAVELPARPRLWRYYSIANAPRGDGAVDFHVRLIDGGAVSMALTAHTAVGTELRIGPPVGALRLRASAGRDLLMVAGSTGLAPLKAMIEQLAAGAQVLRSQAPGGLTPGGLTPGGRPARGQVAGGQVPRGQPQHGQGSHGQPPRAQLMGGQLPSVHLFFGARTVDGLYDLPDLEKLAAEHPWLTVVPVVSDGRFGGQAGLLSGGGFGGQTGLLPDVVVRYGNWSGHDAYLAGPTDMVQDASVRLTAAGMPANQIHVEDFGWSET